MLTIMLMLLAGLALPVRSNAQQAERNHKHPRYKVIDLSLGGPVATKPHPLLPIVAQPILGRMHDAQPVGARCASAPCHPLWFSGTVGVGLQHSF